MALLVTSGTPPKDAVLLTPAEAITYQWRQIKNWPREADVWPFKWGIVGLAVIAAATGGKINKMYRIKLKLRAQGSLTSSLPIIGMPGMMSAVLHAQFVTNNVFLREDACPLCLQGRAALLQVSMAIVYPVFMSTIINFQMATGYATYNMPYWKDGRALFKLFWKLTKPMGSIIIPATLIHTLAAALITYFERRCLYNLQAKIQDNEGPQHVEQPLALR